MGRIIQSNNGKTVIHTVGEEISLITAQPNTYILGVDSVSGIFEKLDPNGTIISLEGSTAAGGGITAVTYSNLYAGLTASSLSHGMFYVITDFQTCYDQPDFDYAGSAIGGGNYKQGPIEPIIVFATSSNTISTTAYQPAYPNDRIQYDWSWNMTEVTSGASFGRITERIDEFNNRTDYDHRNILFKRYRLFTIRVDQPLNGTIELLGDGTINGSNTSFTSLTVGNIISIPSTNPSFYAVTNIADNTTMTVSGDTITAVGTGQTFYKAIEETNDSSDYFSFKRTNVKTDDFIEYTTFGNAQLDIYSYAKNTYVGNYANNYTNTFILANNVFLEGQYESNKFGDYCYNNTFGTDNQNNVWGDWCYENVSTNDIDDNIIGHYFYRNLLNVNLVGNRIGNNFYNNKLLAENNDDFGNNEIGNYFYNNTIYSYFSQNVINTYFYNNLIGDFGNLTEFSFQKNQIRSYFYNNTIGNYFGDNSIGGEFYDNGIFGGCYSNEINYNFNSNTITSVDFNYNIFASNCYSNKINDYFSKNIIDSYFNNNTISNNFQSNIIGNTFSTNNPSNFNLFGWNILSNVSTRTYDTFYQSLGANNAVGNRILGKEFVMKITSTSQYFKIKFTQWSQNGLGGGFQYVRTEIDSSGNEIGSIVKFTNVNNANDVDIVVPGVLEITRSSGGGAIFNTVGEGGYSNSVSPIDTEWNSVCTEPNNGKNFSYNKIGNNFYNNTIGNDFGFGGASQQGNVINDSFQNNTIGQFMYNNVIGNYFTNNIIGDNFESNSIKNYFIGNTIANSFESNEIGDYFGQNGGFIQNTIFNSFKYNKIGNFFGNEFNFPTVSGGTGTNGGNIINDGFQFNQIGDNCIYSMFDLNFDNNKIGNDFWINFFGSNSNNNTIGNLFVGNVGNAGFPSSIGSGFIGNTIKNYAGYNQIGASFTYNEIGNRFGNAGISNYIAPSFSNNKIGNYFGDDGSATTGENLINVAFYGNEIGDSFYNNTINNFNDGGEFYYNKIGNGFYDNVISGYTYYNEIGNDFYSNSISDSFYSNKIKSNFNGSTIGYNFNNNGVESDSINTVDFTPYIGNVSTYILTSSSGGTDGSYFGLTGTTNGAGIGANFDVVVSLSAVSSVVVHALGQYYTASDTFVIDGSLIGGVTVADDVTITINSVTEPSVYGDYNCTIFKRPDGNNRLSYYDNLDVLNVKDINQ